MGMGLKIFSAAQPEVQSSVFQANILVTFPQVTTRIYEKEDYMSMSNTRLDLSLSVFQANILVTFPQVTTRIYEKEDYMSMSNTRIRLST